MCSCGTPQSGSDITGLVSPGFVLRRVRRAREADCEEGAIGWSMRQQRKSAPCAWRAWRAAVVLPRIRVQPRAEMMGANSWVPPHSTAQAAACSARGAQRRATGRREPDAREQYALRARSPQLRISMGQGRGSGQRTRGAMRSRFGGREPDAMMTRFRQVRYDDEVPSSQLLTPRLPRGWSSPMRWPPLR